MLGRYCIRINWEFKDKLQETDRDRNGLLGASMLPYATSLQNRP